MNIRLDVPVGEYRNLTAEELSDLNKLLGESTKTEEGSISENASEVKKTTSVQPKAEKKSTEKRRHVSEEKKKSFKKVNRRKRES